MKKKFISLFLAVNILAGGIVLTSCSKKTNDKEINNHISVETELPKELQTEIPTEESLLNKEIIEELKTKIDSINITYQNEEYYPNEATIKKYKKLANTHYECKEESIISYPDIYLAIKHNTIKNYGEDNGIFYPSQGNYSESEKERFNNFEIAIEEALKHIFKDCKNNYQEDLCSLKNISMMNTSLSNEADDYAKKRTIGCFDNKSNIVYIDYDVIVESLNNINIEKKESNKEEITLIDYLTMIIEHEFNHVRQYPCKHRIEAGDIEQTIGFYDKIPSFIIESSAESGIYNYNSIHEFEKKDNYDYSYLNYRESEALFMLLAAFKENRTLDGYYEAIYDCDIKKFWDFFDLDNDQKLKDFYKIFYAMNTIHERTELSNQIYLENNSVTRSKLEEEVGQSYLNDMWKTVIKDIIDATERDNLTIDDSLLLYLIAKSFVSAEAVNIINNEDDTFYYDFNEEFALLFDKVDNIYKEYLCLKYNITESELKDKLSDYKLEGSVIDLDNYLEKDYDSIVVSPRSRYNNLIEKYPMLKSMLFSRTIITSYMDDLDEYIETLDSSKVKYK